MDSVPLEMDDIFGEYEGEDDDEGFNPSRLPDLEDELEPMRDMRQMEDNQGEEEEDGITDNVELLAKLKSMKGASKNTAKRTMPKLDATRLTGERGIGVLPKVFERVPLKGKNHEAEDLKVMMHTLQHWGHRLFPKMTFDEVLERVERLGSKKEVQTCLKKIRLDMPVLQSDMVDDEEDTVQRAGDDADLGSREDNDHEAERVNDSHNEISDSELDDLLRDQGEAVANVFSPGQSQNSSPPHQAEKPGLSSEMRKKIEENKRKAMERRAAKMAPSSKKDDLCINGISLDSSTNMSVEQESEYADMCQDITDEPDLDVSKSSKSLSTQESNPHPDKSPSNSKSESVKEGTEPFQIHNLIEKPLSPEYGFTEPYGELKNSGSMVDQSTVVKEMSGSQVEEHNNFQEKLLETTECADGRSEIL